MAYVGSIGIPSGGCLFCDKAAQTRDDENLVVHRGALAFVLLNLFPYNTGHLMVAPYLHSADLAALPPDILGDVMALTQHAVRALEQEYRPAGFNLGMNLGRPAGAGVPDHLHLHVVPRWSGDTNFMPVTAETKVLPETLERTYQRLKPYFDGSVPGSRFQVPSP
jgi:ATP adenylyltransferase